VKAISILFGARLAMKADRPIETDTFNWFTPSTLKNAKKKPGKTGLILYNFTLGKR